MLMSNVDAAALFVAKIRDLKRTGEQFQREGKKHLAKANASTTYDVCECFAYHLQEKLWKESGKPAQMVGVHHVNMVLMMVADCVVTTELVMEKLKEAMK